ncbi:MAG: carboxypeptidase [Solirubrobacteraceae bacterium]|nr:carboxypeptidase [Solirubrobacteraceae bacterium]
MTRLTRLTLGMLAALVCAAPASAANLPATLPAVVKSLSTHERGTCVATTYRAPLAGFLDVRLRGHGDWDLELRDAAGRALTSSRGFGGREVAQLWVRGGQRISARGCRGRGAGPSARTSFRLAHVALPKLAPGPVQLLRVYGSDQQLQALESSGLDVTHARGRGWADVIVGGVKQLAMVVASGLRHSVRIADLTKSFASARAADRRYSVRVGAAGSPLPTGRTTYRTYADVQGELKALVDQNAGLVRKVVFGTSYQGREISGIEIGRDVGGDDGRPVFFLMALHHAREWPSMEAAMEFAQMLVSQQADARIADLLARERIVILPIVNPDGFVSSRGAFDPGDTLTGQNTEATLVEAIAPPGGLFAYRRKNCDGELSPSLPCELAWGVDPNRNYGYGWGGPGSSSDVTSQTYHGRGPRSEPEVQAVWNYVRTHEVTSLLTVRNVAALVLRPPGTSGAGRAPDEARLKAIGDEMGTAAGYTSQFGFELYDTSGTTEDDSYAATGGYGFTIEMGPPQGNFHMPYETGVVAEWTGANAHAQNRGGLREALLVAAGAAAADADHAILRGSAPAGRILRLRKRFDTTTSAYCQKGIEAVVDIGLPRICLTGEKPPLTLADELDAQTTVPAGGEYVWHIGQSTRPFGGAAGQKEAYTLTCEGPLGTVHEQLSLVIDRGQTAALNIGCGARQTTFGNGVAVGGDPNAPASATTTPSVNGLAVPAVVARAAKPKVTAKPRTRVQKLAACNRKANRLKTVAKRKAARASCTRRYAKRKPKT